ncbi:hypothetical protein IAS59_005689 [Cryptococcus gattii]
MSTAKVEGFSIPGNNHMAPRPNMHRPFSDGSMTVDTDLLASLMSGGSPHQTADRGQFNMATSPFSFSQSLPVRHHSFDYSLPSPLSTSINIAGHMRNSISGGTGANSGGIFNAVKFGNEHPEPPVSLPPATDAPAQGGHQRSRSQSSTHSVGKAPSTRSRQARKSMTDVRPPRSSLQRGRSQVPTRPMGLGASLDTHVEDEMTDSISPPDFGANGAFGLAIASGRDSFNNDTASWASGSVPSMVPGSLGSFDTDEVLVDSPITPVKPLLHLSDENYKKQRRRECHNLVEKRRREHINAKIEELGTLLPEKYNQIDEPAEEEDEDGKAAAKKKKNKRGGNISAKAQKDAAHCKGRILSQSVNYIRDLKQVTETQASRISQLEQLLMNLGVNTADENANANQGFPQQHPLFWLNNNGLNNFPDSGEHNLQAMRPSPEPERHFSFDIVSTQPWSDSRDSHESPHPVNGLHPQENKDMFIPFQPSPSSTNSSHPPNVSNFRRASQSGSSDMDMDPLSPLGVGEEGVRDKPRERAMRQDSQIELQMGMSGLFNTKF